MSRIEVPNRFGPSQARSWIRTWCTGRERPDLTLALPPDACLDPAGIVFLAAGIARRQAHGLRTSITGGDEANVPLQGLEPLRDLEVVRRQAAATRENLESVVPAIPPTTIRAAYFAFEELGSNVVQHSSATKTGFGLAMPDPDRRRIQIAFCDAGVGFRASLRSNRKFEGQVEDHEQALRFALGKNTSWSGSGNIGMGLDFLATFADRLQGDLWIASGNALLVRCTDGDGRRTERIDSTTGWNGAWLCLDAPVPGW